MHAILNKLSVICPFRPLALLQRSAILLLVVLNGCGLSRQAQEAATLSKCEFRLISVDKITLGGVNFQNVKSVSDLGFTDLAMLMGGFSSPVFPLTMQVNLEGRNPNTRQAGVNRVDWILYIDDVQITSGSLDKPFLIPPNNGITIIPVQVAMDLKKALSGESSEAMINFAMNLAGMGNKSTKLKIRIKPTILIGGKEWTYPGFINVTTTYSGR